MPEMWEKPQADADHAHDEHEAEIEERAMDVFDNHYDGPSDPASFRKAVAEVWKEAAKVERETCARMAQSHGEFCEREARNGGAVSLFERGDGAEHIAAAIRAGS